MFHFWELFVELAIRVMIKACLGSLNFRFDQLSRFIVSDLHHILFRRVRGGISSRCTMPL